MNSLLSVVIPCYNEAAGIRVTVETLCTVLEGAGLTFELVLVNDGSADATYTLIEAAAAGDPTRVRGVCLTRNFGKEAAILAGLAASKGACAVVLDGDLQHPPEVIAEMYALWQSGYEIVEGVKRMRQREGLLHKLFAKGFYAVFSRAIGLDLMNASDFKLLDRKVIDVLLNLPERHTFFRGLTYWTGFRMAKVLYTVQPRRQGKTKWSFLSLMRYATRNIISFSSAPLGLISVMSGGMLLLALIFGIRAFRLYLTNQAAGGITTVVVLLLLIGGLILFSMSIIGNYISSIYDEVKNRPRYLISRTTDSAAPHPEAGVAGVPGKECARGAEEGME